MIDTSVELCTLLGHELAVALEMSYDEVELRELWPDALDALDRTRHLLMDKGIAVPAAIENVLRLSKL